VWAAGNGLGGGFVEINGPSGPLRATAIAASGAYNAVNWNAIMPAIGCAVVGGAVWCFPIALDLTDSTVLGGGLGPTDTTSASSPVQVLTPTVGNTPLANVTQIAGGTAQAGNNVSSGANFCAVTSDGGVWCWGFGGHGELGNGGAANSSYAAQVKANAASAFTGAVEVRVGWESACARKNDGSVWCWGTNAHYELGVPSGTLSTSYYPVQVAFTGTSAQTTATRLAVGYYQNPCAIMQDTSVVCWGQNDSSQSGAPVADAGVLVGPNRILVSAGGPALTGIVDLAADGQESMCAKDSNLEVLCWGVDSSGPYPAAYQNGVGTAAVGIVAPLTADDTALGYVDPSGLLITAKSSSGPVPSCANLLP
jgi:hypothetical protein